MVKRFYMALITILCAIGITIIVSYAWFLNDENVDPIAQGYSGEAYFAYGNGGSGENDRPYGINTPRHLYNLAWLCYLDPEHYANKNYEIDPSLQDSLDMYGWTLPPIGKDNAAFTGTFDGNGKTIYRLTTSNDLDDMDRKPNSISSDEIVVNTNQLKNATSIGFFGNISGNGSTQVHDFCLQNTTVKTATSSTCIGIVAGYVNGKIENVGVVQSGLDLGNTAHSATHGSNVSDYTVVGYATDDYVTKAYNKHTLVYNPNTSYSHFNYGGMGGANSWGGSMNFSDMFQRYKITRDSSYIATSGQGYNFNYVYQEVIKSDGTSYTTGGIRNSSNDNYSYNNKYYYQRRYLDTGADYDISSSTTPETLTDAQKLAANGVYKRALRTNSTSDPGTGTGGPTNDDSYGDRKFNYINALYKEVYTITENGSEKTGYKIHDGNGNYLGYNCDGDGYITTNETNAVIWLLDNSGGLYTYDQEEYSTTIIRYLNGTTDLIDALSSTKSTSWSWDGTYNTFKYNYNGKDYYLNCINGEFSMASNFVITDGNGNYAKWNGTNIVNIDNSADATVWVFSTNGDAPHGYLTNIADSKRLAISGTSLTENDTGTSWSYDGTNLYNGNQVIKFDGTNWVVDTPNTFLIHYNGHYLLSTLNDTTSEASATVWTFGNTLYNVNGTGNISYISGGNTYYLNFNNSNSNKLEIAQSNPTTWSHDQYGIYYTYNNTKYYIQYNSRWEAGTVGQTIYSNGYYLEVNGTDITLSTSSSTVWFIDNNYIYTNINGSKYYLYRYSTYYVGLTTNINQTGIAYKDGNYIRASDGQKYRLYYYSSWGGWYFRNSNTSVTFSNDYNNTHFASGVLYVDYISKCNDANIGLIRTAGTTYEYQSTKNTVASEFNYVPLITNKNDNETTLNVSDNNTGYLIGGSHESSAQKADIRVSEYNMTDVSGAVNTSSSKFSSFKSNSIKTVYMNGSTATITTITDETATVTATGNSLERYSKAKTGLQQIFNNQQYIYGLHFMDATISKNNLVTAPVVYINGTYYTNYQMPEDCIDFRLAQAGYITFFAGTYYSQNNSFFSLNTIERDANDKITAIKHIYYIYEDTQAGDNDPKYVYVYANETDLYASQTARYTKKFDYRTIEQPGTYSALGSNNIYYFEIPVNAGEFALGSVTGRTGAYLFYLDIGANAAPIDRTIVTQKTETVVQTYQFANGIQILESTSNSIDAWDSCVAKVSTSTTGTILVSRANDEITFSQNLSSTYIGNGITAKYNLTSLTLTPVDTDTSTLNILKYVDYDIAKDRLYVTTIENNGSNNTAYSIIRLVNDNGTIKEYEIINNSITSKELIESAEYGLIDNDGNQVYEFNASKIITNDFTSVVVDVTGSLSTILSYVTEMNTQTNNNSINQTIGLNLIRVTGSDSTLGITNGKKTITIGTGANAETVELEHVYKLDGNGILISAPGISTAINTSTVSNDYSFYINGTKVVANTTYTIQGNVVYQVTSDTTKDTNKAYYIKTELYEINNSDTPASDGLYELVNGSYVATSDATKLAGKIYFEKKDNYIPALINDIISSIANNPNTSGYYEITNDYSSE